MGHPIRAHLVVMAGALLLAGCAGTSTGSIAPASTGYMNAGVRSSINVTNTSYERAIQCSGATARLISYEQSRGASDVGEVSALGQAWLDNATEIGSNRGLAGPVVQADATAAGAKMSSADAATVWAGCRSGK